MSIAQDEFKSGRFASCLSSTSRAETYGSFSPEVDAQIMYYKAMCLEGVGEKAASIGILERLIARHPDTIWAKAGAQSLRQLDCTKGPVRRANDLLQTSAEFYVQ